MKFWKKCLFSVLAAIALAPQAHAEFRNFGSAAGYEVVGFGSTRDESGNCLASFEYGGPGSTRLTIFRDIDKDEGGKDTITLSISNYEWSAKYKQFYELKYEFDSYYYDRSAMGIKEDEIRKGFISIFPAEDFLDVYAKSKSLNIFMGETVVDKLSLTGSTAGIALFNRCWTWLQSTERAAQAERDRYKDIPRDPFAKKDDAI